MYIMSKSRLAQAAKTIGRSLNRILLSSWGATGTVL
jgi:hypothetical protein